MGPKKTTKQPKLNGITVQTALYNESVAVGYGRVRVSPNLIDYDDFTAIPVRQKTGGKGGPTPISSYNYTATVILAIGKGVVSGVPTIFIDSSVYSDGAETALEQAGLTFFNGSIGQTPWAFMTSNHPTKARGYSGLAYVCASGYALDSSGGLPNHTMEVNFAIQESSVTTGDANFADVIEDILTNDQYGLPGWASGLIGDLTSYRTYCRAQNLLGSPLLDSQRQMSDLLTEWLKASNSDIVWTNGVLNIVPYGDMPVTGNGITFSPDVTPIYDLTEDDFLGDADPVSVSVSDIKDAYNIMKVYFNDRTRQYNQSTMTAIDPANIAQFGKRAVQSPESMPCICDPQVANVVAHLMLQRQLYVRRQYSFKLPNNYDALDPMDIVTITTTVGSLVLNRYPVRVVSVDEAEDGSSYVTEDMLIGTANAPLYSFQGAGGLEPNYSADPGNISAPLIFNPPSGLVSDLEVWCAVAGLSPNWGGCEVYISVDGATYNLAATIGSGARYGVTTADFPVGSDPDTANTLSVDLTTSNGVLTSATDAQADVGATLCWVGGEIISYSTATLTATAKYNLTTYIRRGQNGTAIVDHASGTHFARLDTSIFKYVYLPQQVGQTIYVKFASFNIYGRALQDISTLTAYSIVLGVAQSIPPAVTGLALQAPFNTQTVTVVWQPVADATSYTVTVLESDGTTVLRTSTSYGTSYSYNVLDAAADEYLNRERIIQVVATNAAGDSAPTTLTVTNAAPAIPTGVGETGSGGSRAVSWNANTEVDLAGYLAFYSSTSGFDPTTGGGVLFYQGTAPGGTLSGLASGTTYYVRVAAYDTWSDDPAELNFCPQSSFTT